MDSVTYTQANGASLPEKIRDRIDDLLQPVHFDWADDVEEDIQGTSDSSESLMIFPFENTTESSQSDSIFLTSCEDIIEEISIENASIVKEDQSNRSNISRGSDMPLILSSTPCVRPSDLQLASSPDQEISQTEIEVTREFSWRAYCTYQDQDIHHFNWLGCPVYGYSWTPPAVSLLYMLADPKIPKPGDEYRLQSILCRATTYVDPVLVYLEEGLDSLRLKGHDLIRFATGRVFKFYTPHGQWTKDWREKEDQTTIDDGDVYSYISPGLAMGNGFVEICPIRSRSKWVEARDERFAASRALRGRPNRSKRKGRVYKPSPLSQSMVPDDLAPERTANETNGSHAVVADSSEEAYDSVGALAEFVSPCKRPLRRSTCRPSKRTLKRRNGSPGLKFGPGTSQEYVRDSDSFATEEIEGNLFNAGIEPRSSASLSERKPSTQKGRELAASSAPAGETREYVTGAFKPDQPIEATADVAARAEIQLSVHPDLTCCETPNENRELSSGLSNRTSYIDLQDPYLSTGTGENLAGSRFYSKRNASIGYCADFDPPVELLFLQCSDVQFIKSRPQTDRRSRGALDDWKTKWKDQKGMKRWHRASTKARTILGLTKARGSPLSNNPPSSDSYASTHLQNPLGSLQSGDVPSTEDGKQKQRIIIEWEFVQECFSLPMPLLYLQLGEPNQVSISSGGSHAGSSNFPKPGFVCKISAKGRSFYNKTQRRFHRSSDTGADTRKQTSLSKVAIVGCSATWPCSCQPG